MKFNYDKFLDRLIRNYEGGYGWDRGDPGGPTKYGITCYDLAEHRHQRMNSMTAWAPVVRELTLHEAEDIYHEKYAVGIMFDDLPSGVDCCLLDYAVNSGVSRAVRVARALANMGSGDRMTVALVGTIKNIPAEKFIDKICDERLHFLRGLHTWGEFGHGWARRVADLRAYCRALAKQITPHDVTHPTPFVPKGKHLETVAVKGRAVVLFLAAGAVQLIAGVPWDVVLAVCAILAVSVGWGLFLHSRKAKALNALVVTVPVKP